VNPVESSAAVVGVTFSPAGNLWNDRIDRAHEKRRRKDDERHEIEDAAHEDINFARVQRFASRSNSTSMRNSGSISFRGSMLGPSDGALSGS
jgi:hypothetical protein